MGRERNRCVSERSAVTREGGATRHPCLRGFIKGSHPWCRDSSQSTPPLGRLDASVYFTVSASLRRRGRGSLSPEWRPQEGPRAARGGAGGSLHGPSETGEGREGPSRQTRASCDLGVPVTRSCVGRREGRGRGQGVWGFLARPPAGETHLINV